MPAPASRLTVHGRYGADPGFVLDSGSVLGVYLARLPGTSNNYAENEAVWLCWTDADNRMVLQVPARVRHADVSGVRVQFEAGHAAQVEQVLALVPRKALADGAGARPAERAITLIIDAIRSDFVGACRTLIEALAHALDTADGDTDGTTIGAQLTRREAAQQLRTQKVVVEQEFRRRLTHAWRQPVAAAATASAHSAAPPALINDGEMRAWLAGRLASRKLERSCQASWKPLRQFVQPLLLGRTGIHVEALSVTAVIDALAQSLNAAELDPGLQDLALQRASEPPGLDIPLRYRRLLQALQRAGVRTDATDGAPAPTPDSAAPSPATNMRRAPAPPLQPALAWTTLRQMSLPLAEGVDPNLLAGGGPIADSMLLRAAADVLGTPGPTTATELRARLLQRARRLAGNPRAALEQRQHAAIDLIARMHAELDRDPLLPNGFRERCRPLLRPILAMELQGDALAQASASARQLLGLIEFASELVSSRTDPVTQRLRASVDAEVDALARAPSWSAAELAAVCERLEPLLQRPRAASLASEKRVVETCEGQQRMTDARAQLQRELARLFAGQPLPQALLVVIERRLSATLLPVLLRAGLEGGEWQVAFGRLKLLHDALRQAASGHPCTDVQRHLGWLRDACGGPSDERVLERCLAHIEAALGGAAVPLTTFAAAEPQAAAPVAPTNGANPPGALASLKVGDWLTQSTPGAQPRALRLAWRAPDGGRFVFVNRLGQKIDEIDAAVLQRELAEGSARVAGRVGSDFAARAWRHMLIGRHRDLIDQATLDAVTGLLNPRELERRLHAWLVAPERAPLLLLWFEVAQFDAVSRTHGGAAGDQLLVEFAELLSRHLAPGPGVRYAARIDVDQFVAVLQDVPLAQAERLAHACFDRACALELTFDDSELRLLPTMGMVAADAATASIERLLADARRACATAGSSGPGRWHRHQSDSSVLERMRDAANWVRRVDEALPAGGLVLYGQRAQGLAANRQAEYIEVLLRMRTVDGMIAPGESAVAVERYGQIAAMDRHIVQELASALTRAQPHRNLRIAFNVSACNLIDGEYVDEVIETLRRQPVPLRQLCIEVSESALLAQIDGARDGLQRLADAGFSLVLDNAGSGAAALGQLSGLPFDLIKVGGAYLRDITRSAADRALVRSINEIAHLHGKRTLAEHVEEQAALDELRALGFDYAQGYLMGQPVPLAELLG